MSLSRERAILRWRLLLGRYAERGTGCCPDGADARVDRALGFLYDREYHGRGVRDERGAGLDPSQPNVPLWLNEVRDLFPKDVVEVIEKHALDRYGLTELLNDPDTLQRLQPNEDLLQSLLMLRGHLRGDVLDVARRIVRQVVEEIQRRLEPDVRRALAGRLNRFRHTPVVQKANFDAKGTLRKNLRHFDRERKSLAVERLLFFERNTRRLPWTVVLCVDQSGSMASSVIHSAVMAGILASLPVVRVKLVVFGADIVDLSDRVDDPVEVMMSVQLGGGTDIARAVSYCEQLIDNPLRTIFVLVTDFFEGGSHAQLIGAVKRLAEMRVRLLGLAALNERGQPNYDREMAQQLADCGMEIAALTPSRFAEWLASKIS